MLLKMALNTVTPLPPHFILNTIHDPAYVFFQIPEGTCSSEIMYVWLYIHTCSVVKFSYFFIFSVMLRTTPMDSTGVPHILEHTTLCGSQRFPVRDPFFKMFNRSLSTFMNALTGILI